MTGEKWICVESGRVELPKFTRPLFCGRLSAVDGDGPEREVSDRDRGIERE